MNLDHLAQLATEATPGPWDWGWRPHDDDAPGSVYRWTRVTTDADGTKRGTTTAIAMCPKYGKDTFEHDAAFIAAANPSVVLALVEVARAAQSVIHPKLDEWSFPRWDEASAKAVAESKLCDALAKLDNLEGTE